MQITLNVPKELADRIEAELQRRAGEDGEPMDIGEGILFFSDYALRRIAVLAKHAGKVKKVKRAVREGKAIPANVEFKRYVPIFKTAKLDAEGTPREVAKWAHAAPENKAAEIAPARPRKTKKAKVKIDAGNAEVAAAL